MTQPRQHTLFEQNLTVIYTDSEQMDELSVDGIALAASIREDELIDDEVRSRVRDYLERQATVIGSPKTRPLILDFYNGLDAMSQTAIADQLDRIVRTMKQLSDRLMGVNARVASMFSPGTTGR